MHRVMLIVVPSIAFFFNGCKIPAFQMANEPRRAAFTFGFPGRLENLEDAFFAAKLQYAELDFKEHWQRKPQYEFTVTRGDTILRYIISMEDCQSFYYLVQYNTNWNCDSGYLNVDRYTANIPTMPPVRARSIFEEEVIRLLKMHFYPVKSEYHWKIEKVQDTTYVKVVDHLHDLRKMYIYSMDTVMNHLAEKEIYNYLGDSIIHYRRLESQRYVYIESKEVTRN
jgi:hypothetical protein